MEPYQLYLDIGVSLATLTFLEIVLGIDNLIFISILADKLPENQRAKARQLGLGLALVTRIALLSAISWMMKLTKPLFEVFDHEVTGKDIILILGGLFLMYKSTSEIHEKLEGEEHENTVSSKAVSFGGILIQIMLLDVVFSIDSVITAVGMVDQLWVMVVAVILAVIVMIMAVNSISGFVNRHPTVKMLALSFLLMIGLVLVADGLGHHVPKGYVYSAMGFSILVEFLNIRARGKKAKPVELRGREI